jgi:acetyl esterase/lipase
MICARRQAMAGLVAAGAGLGLRWPRQAMARGLARASFDINSIAPELRPFVPMMERQHQLVPAYTAALLPRLRAIHQPFGAIRADVPCRQLMLPGLRGQPPVGAWLVNAGQHADPRPALLHLHGGGFVIGSAAQGLRPLQDLCAHLGAVGLSVDYRLAPEARHDAIMADAFAALVWLHAQGQRLGIDRQRIAVMGESAGGGLAALLAVYARDAGLGFAYQALSYPMLDDRTGAHGMPPPGTVELVWSAASNRFGWHSFLGVAPGGPDVPTAAVPARIAHLAGLPPAFIGVGSVDMFAPECATYAARLRAAGVRVDWAGPQGAVHGFDLLFAQTHLAQRFVAARAQALSQALQAGARPHPRKGTGGPT